MNHFLFICYTNLSCFLNSLTGSRKMMLTMRDFMLMTNVELENLELTL